ncbi:caspase-7 [Patella vulgata]|uniref:caspase-7 n=1 Tax=Patella vulgata TaxID=6465 RepID=UPI0021806E4B|nr:caspase-7 [Patella vulgata]
MDYTNRRHDICQEVGPSRNYIQPSHFSQGPQAKPFNYGEEYDFTHKRRGIALIINNDTFEDGNLIYRKGSENDTIKLEACFNKLGFDTRIMVNVTKYETVKYLRQVANEMTKEPDFDCFVLAISSHGDVIEGKNNTVIINQDVLNCTDTFIPTCDVLNIFSDANCPGLKDKPRLCFIQACRGYDLDPGMNIGGTDVSSMEVVDGVPEYNAAFGIRVSQRVITNPFPCMKDFIVMYATPPGFHAFRRQKEGSWFITALTNVLGNVTEKNRTSINKLLTKVVYLVAYNYQSNSNIPEYDRKKQTPCIYSMLTKSIFLKPK